MIKKFWTKHSGTHLWSQLCRRLKQEALGLIFFGNTYKARGGGRLRKNAFLAESNLLFHPQH